MSQKAIYRQQEEFELVRKIELAEVQRLEAEARRKALEKERRVEQELLHAAERQTLEEKIAAQYFAQQYLGSLHSGVFDTLEEQGFFFDPLQKEIEEITMVDLLASLRSRSDFYEAAQEIADELIAAARMKAKEYEDKAVKFRQIALQRRIEKEAAAVIEKALLEKILAEKLALVEDAGEEGENPEEET